MNKVFLFGILLIIAHTSFAANSISGSPQSFEQAFESLLKSDGAVAEEWDIEIGKRIKTHPTNFLKALKLYRGKVKRLDALVGNLGPEYVDDFHRQKIELQKRVNSLSSVKDNALKSLANECVSELNKQIKVVSGSES